MKQTIRQHHLLEQTDHILVALSGGPDSVALLHLLSKMQRPLRLSLAAVYINHGIRKRAAAAEERFCAGLCARFGVPLSIVRENVPALAARLGKGVEEAGRDFRYQTFDHLADEFGCNKIALGHHTDDQVETILFRIIRGTGPGGLAGIPARRGRIIRPLFDCTKQQILNYLAEHSLEYCHDRSNESNDYSRNFIRNRLLPQIRQRLNRSVDSALLNLAELSIEEKAFLDRVTAAALLRTRRDTPGGKIVLALAPFRTYDRWLRRRLLRYCVTELLLAGAGPDKTAVDRLDELAACGGKGLSLQGGVQAVVFGGTLVLCRRATTRFCQPLGVGAAVRLSHPRLTLRCRATRGVPEHPARRRRSRRVVLDRGAVALPLTVRNIHRGDRFQPLGMKGTKKVGDYLTDCKVPPVFRDEIPVVCDREGIVWLVGFEIADRVKIDRATCEVLTLECSEPRGGRNAAV